MIKTKSNTYFTEETEKYIVLYNNSQDPDYRAKIFTDHIYYPFYKLAENIIHTYKFHYTDVDRIDDLKHEIVSVLLEEKISKFDPQNGAKAYSYFGTIVKRWLINYNNKNYKTRKQIGSFTGKEELYEEPFYEEASHEISLSKFIDSYVEEMYESLETNFPKLSERKIADAILTIFKTRYDLDIFKKKALYIYIREMTDQDTPQITKVIKNLKKVYLRLLNQYLDYGYVSLNY